MIRESDHPHFLLTESPEEVIISCFRIIIPYLWQKDKKLFSVSHCRWRHYAPTGGLFGLPQ